MSKHCLGRALAKSLVVSCVASLLAACTAYGRLTAVEITPSPGAELRSGDEIRFKADYQIDRYLPGVRYGAALFFSVSGGRTATAVKSEEILSLENSSGSIELTVPVSKVVGPPLALRNDAIMWLYILRYHGDSGADPVVIGGPFHYKISDEARSTSKQPPSADPASLTAQP